MISNAAGPMQSCFQADVKGLRGDYRAELLPVRGRVVMPGHPQRRPMYARKDLDAPSKLPSKNW